jgi:hypothetical protein
MATIDRSQYKADAEWENGIESPMGRPRRTPIITVPWEGQERPAIEVFVKQWGTSGGAYLPKDWIGSKVLAIRLE